MSYVPNKPNLGMKRKVMKRTGKTQKTSFIVEQATNKSSSRDGLAERH